MKILIDLGRRWIIGDLIGSLVMMISMALIRTEVTIERSEIIVVLLMSGLIGLYSALFVYLERAFYQIFLLHFILTVGTVILANWYLLTDKLTLHFDVVYTLSVYFIIWIVMWWWERDERRQINEQIKQRRK
ncbi:DUF3021 family protein [Weissella cibaria]|uniref:DUF3021 domain-containing protein n=1 Tax=Weissella cibaria TaxID=137591 RepID=A0A0D1JN00_9LACO|nr:DUF3021 family protein [Weissella cibaria]ALI32421.1 hypothetical protein AO080_02665 [Weissella cibaria]AVO67008.1 DUF3021 domain-containing protein [Weissella cibaria]KIU22653.1 hypothetical protein QX99_00157 [Weissella cibaria]KIU24113.1 hypothetical protein ff3pr_00513 [Weissella cibaria]MBD1501469.1 DUF3021 family protein [Weissella cibaria]